LEEISGQFSHGYLDGDVTIIGSGYSFITHAKVKAGVLHGSLVTFGVKPLYDENPNNLEYLPFRLMLSFKFW